MICNHICGPQRLPIQSQTRLISKGCDSSNISPQIYVEGIIESAFWENLGWSLATVIAKVRQRPSPGILMTRDTGKIVLPHYKSQPQNGNRINPLNFVNLICAACVPQPRDKIIGFFGYWNSSQ